MKSIQDVKKEMSDDDKARLQDIANKLSEAELISIFKSIAENMVSEINLPINNAKKIEAIKKSLDTFYFYNLTLDMLKEFRSSK